jgi:hypothetical protein
MAVGYAKAFDSANISIGPAFIYYNGVHLGHTYGGVSVSITQNVFELKSDQYGETPVRTQDAGVSIDVTANLTESTFANLQVLFASASLVSEDEGPPLITEHLEFGKPIGGSITAYPLIVEPTDGSDIITIYKAAPNIGSAIEIAFNNESQRVYATTFKGLIDDSRAEGDQLFRIGGYDASIE